MVKSFHIHHIPFYKKLLSYVYPVALVRTVGANNVALEVDLYCNRLQLGNTDILYSDGRKYEPAVIAVKKLKASLPSVKNVLVLGTGLGSIVRVIHSKGYDPQYTLVEYDEKILQLAVTYLGMDCPSAIEPVCSDAMLFMEKNTTQYSFIFIDIFIGRMVPDFVSSPAFLNLCRNSLAPGGRLAFNYISNDEKKWEATKLNFSAVFPQHTITEHDVNRVFVTEAV